MLFNEIVEENKENVLEEERTINDIVEQWDGLRQGFAKFLKVKGEAAASDYVDKWIGSLGGAKDVAELSQKLRGAGRKLDSADTALIKVINNIIGKRKETEGKTSSERSKEQRRREEIRGQQIVQPRVKY